MNSGYLPRKPARVVGMVHLKALPGSAGFGHDLAHIRETALRDASALCRGGVDAILVENMADLPYLRGRVGSETAAMMALMVDAVIREVSCPVGLQLLAAANEQAMAIAATTGASFMRVEGFAYAHVADEGWIDACAAELTRQRARLQAPVAIWADIKKKHSSHAITADLSLEEMAHGHRFCAADVLIVTGTRTGVATAVHDVSSAQTAGLPVAVGSGVTASQAIELASASAWIVGTSLKVNGDWRAPVDERRVRALVQARDQALS